jgi:hypothetical protein
LVYVTYTHITLNINLMDFDIDIPF